MFLAQDPVTGFWTKTEDNNLNLVGIHNVYNCRQPCPIHNSQSTHPLQAAPLYWNPNRAIIERVCSHGVHHPDYDSAMYYYSVNQTNENVHMCDGCCGLL